MDSGIALLLGGSCADLSATLHAVELAKRTTAIVHVVFTDSGEAETRPGPGGKAEDKRRYTAGELIALARWLGDVEAVTIHIHRLDSLADGLVARFIREYRIFCLIVGAGNQGAAKRHNTWVEKLRRHLAAESRGLAPSLWSVVMEPWDEPMFERIIARFKLAGWSMAAIATFTGLTKMEKNTIPPDDR